MSLLKKIIKLILLSAMLLFLIGLGIPIGIMMAYWDDLPSLEPLEYEAQSWHYPTKVYSDIAKVCPQIPLKKLLRRLERLGYQQVNDEPVKEGQFSRESVDSATGLVKLYLREVNCPRLKLPARLIDIQIGDGKIAKISNMAGKSLSEFVLEPEVIAEFYGSEGTDRELVTLSQVPEFLSKSFIAIEDKRFHRHWGFDPYRVVAALWWDIRHLSRGQGASTITQQLAKDLFLTKEKRITRKVREVLLAIKIEKKYTKDEILERYLNRVNLGRYRSREVYGVGEAARYYFGKDVWELNIQECATLAGIVNNPPRYSPIRNPEKAYGRRQLVLRQMLREGFITESEYQEAIASPLVTMPVGDTSSRRAAYFLEHVRAQLEREYESGAIYRRGLKVYTTLDMSMQIEAESAVQTGLRILDDSLRFPPYEDNKAKWSAGERGEKTRDPSSYIQAALVSIDPSTGYVKAMVGGRDWYVNQFNRATKALRQPGSAFKPFIYCTAFVNGLATPVSIVVDEPWEIEDPSQPGGFWRPRNFYEEFYGQVTVRKMLVHSINVATARLLYEKIGADRVVPIARSLGIRSPLSPVPSLALGSSGVTVLEMTSAYGVWANQGVHADPICIRHVLDMEDNILWENTPPPRRVLDENVAFLLTYLMEGVINGGTGRNVRWKFGFDRPAAGKTGTTNDETDAWFIGFVPDLVTGVWVGFDDYSKSVRYSGALAALPIWVFFMESVVEGAVKDFPVPDGIVFKDVDADTGLPATNRSTNAVREAFIKGTEPTGK